MEPISDSKGLTGKDTNSQELRAFPAPFGSFFNSSCIVVPQPVTGVHPAKKSAARGTPVTESGITIATPPYRRRLCYQIQV